jgi:hypothetical protein
MTVADSLITLLAPEIGTEQAKYLLLDFIKVSTVRGRVSRAEHRSEVLAEAERALLSTTDGYELHDDAEIPAGEIRRILAALGDGGAR